jgi:inorganic triphosphatase YgiF
MSPPREIELKLQLPDGAAELLPRVAPLSEVAGRTTRLDATYFDTSDRLLQKHAMALRLRRVGRQWVQTLKVDDSARGGLSSRSEWESPAKLRRGKPQIDLSLLHDTPLPALLAKHAASSLLPVFRSKFVRTAWLVNFRKSRIEVAMDRGTIEAQRDGRRVAEPIAELELELKEGRAEDLVRLALQLAGRGRRALALVPLARSKAARGYRLADAAATPPTKAAARGFVQVLDPKMSSGAALRAIIAHGLDVLLANTDALRDLHDPEYVHQARVALRRMRSALRLFDREQADFPSALADEMRWAARLLGNARDWDVFAGQTLPALIAGAHQEIGANAQALADRAQKRCDAARSAVASELASARYAQLVLRVQAWTLTKPPDGRTLERLAPRALRKASARLLAAARFFAALSPERRHRVRILAKRLRYALDFLSVALPKSATEQYVAALSDLQDVLGELNDAAVARAALRKITRSESILAVAEQWLSVREQVKGQEAEAGLLALAETVPPWD